jgi:hypothetical protein
MGTTCVRIVRIEHQHQSQQQGRMIQKLTDRHRRGQQQQATTTTKTLVSLTKKKTKIKGEKEW